MVTGLAALGVGVRYGGVVALDAVDIVVPCGEIVGLIGPNGACLLYTSDAADE